MRAAIFAGLLVPGVLAGGDSCPAPTRPASGNGNFAPGPGSNVIPSFGTHTWSRISPSEVLSSLSAIGVTIPSQVGGYLPSSIQPPPGCTSLPQTYSTSTTPAASSTYPGSSPSGHSGTYHTSTPTTLSRYTKSSSRSSTRASASRTSGSTSSTSSTSGSTSGSTSSRSSTSSTGSSTSSTSSSTTSSSSSSTSTSTSSSSTTTSSTPTQTKCSSPTARVEWRNLTPQQQEALAQANQCLMLAPPRAGFANAKSRWDELVAIHQQMANTVHQVGQFLAWHRQFLWVYEQELRNYCKYTGPMSWWDETKDAGDYHQAPMMTSQLYGSAPVGNAQCITNGLYAGIILNIGPGSTDVPHCLSRGVDESLSADVTNSFVNACNSYSDYAQMENCQFFGPHAYTHDAIGAVMSDIASSPGDPLFYLHHGFVDRNYRNWQLIDPHNRTYEIGGYTTQNCLNGGSGCTLTTLNYVLTTLGYQPDVTIAQVADTQGDHLCYYYDY